MSIRERIKYLIELAGSQTKFARATDISVQTIAKFTSVEGHVRSDTLEAILNSYPNLNARWLLTGVGEIWEDGQAPNTILQFPNTTRQNQGSNILVPVRAFAGYVAEYTQEQLQAAEPVLIPGITGEARTWEIEGTSMEPIILEGDWISGNRVNSLAEMMGGNIYILVTRSQGIHIKHSWPRGSRIYCQPSNYQQEGYYLDADDVLEIWDAKVRVTRNLLIPFPVTMTMDENMRKYLLPVVRIEGYAEEK
jgi:hypothetical protein